LSGRGLCDELIIRPEESYRLCCVVVCDLETSRMGAPYMYDISRLRVKSVLIYGAETCSLYEDDRRRINATEMDALRWSSRFSKLDRKTNEYVRGKMDAQDMILDDITRKQLIWYGHVERMDPTWLPKIMIHWKPEGRKKRGSPREYLERWNIYTAMNGRDLRMGEWNNRR